MDGRSPLTKALQQKLTEQRPRPQSAIDEPGLKDLVEWAEKAPPGDFVEVGVFRGGSAWFLYAICKEQGRTLYLFDTFEGMPFRDEIDVVPVGYFNGVSCDYIDALYPEAQIYKGIFPGTLPRDLYGLAFVHVDCDQYRSIKACIDFLVPRMVPGGIMYFDDYLNMPGAKQAVDEGLQGVESFNHRGVWVKNGV